MVSLPGAGRRCWATAALGCVPAGPEQTVQFYAVGMGEPVTKLADLLGRATVLLIDFDGPIWSASAGPADGLGDVLRAAQARRWRIGVVSNNDSDSINAHIRADDELRRYVNGLAARVDSLDPGYLMPHPFLVRAGVTGASHGDGTQPADAVLVSAVPCGIEAAWAAGVPAIGYAHRPGDRERLIVAGAGAIADTLDELADTIATGSHLPAQRPPSGPTAGTAWRRATSDP